MGPRKGCGLRKRCYPKVKMDLGKRQFPGDKWDEKEYEFKEKMCP
jgi:hypothetical protein